MKVTDEKTLFLMREFSSNLQKSIARTFLMEVADFFDSLATQIAPFYIRINFCDFPLIKKRRIVTLNSSGTVCTASTIILISLVFYCSSANYIPNVRLLFCLYHLVPKVQVIRLDQIVLLLTILMVLQVKLLSYFSIFIHPFIPCTNFFILDQDQKMF